eukprot:930349-Alexandrium_andersonii.AAC.1
MKRQQPANSAAAHPGSQWVVWAVRWMKAATVPVNPSAGSPATMTSLAFRLNWQESEQRWRWMPRRWGCRAGRA